MKTYSHRLKTFYVWIILALSAKSMLMNAQVRRHIETYTHTERTFLANAMLQYISPQIIETHCNFDPDQDDVPMIHSDFDFLPFHRMYIQGMEDYLMSLGPYYWRFVPLPKWEPSDCVPMEFRIVDPHCSYAVCNNGNGPCSMPTNWCPTSDLPNYLSLPTQTGPGNDLCDWNMNPSMPIGADVCCPDGLSFNIENTYHNPVHVVMGGVMGCFRSPSAPVFWLWHAYVDDMWKIWETNCTQSTTKPIDLWMADNKKVITSDRDRGEEPSIDYGPTWTSQDIWVRNQQDGITNQVHQDPVAVPGMPVYVYVRVRNRGYATSLGAEQIQLRWAKASTALTWPASWDGSTYLNAPANTVLAGNIITTQILSTPITAGNQQIIEIPWYPPNPSDYDSLNTEPWHFCLLARIIDPTDPMPLESWDVNANVKQYNNIVLKNMNVIDNMPGIVAGGGCPSDLMQGIGEAASIGNPFNQATTFDISFSVPEEELGKIESGRRKTSEIVYGDIHALTASVAAPEESETITKNGTVIVALDKQFYEKWVLGGKKGKGFKEIKTNSSILSSELPRKLFEITSVSAVFENVTLDIHETRTASLMVIYPSIPVSGKQVFNYDVIQKRTDNGMLIGGITYSMTKAECITKMVLAGYDRSINPGASTTLTAEPQLPCAKYEWSDLDGNLVSKQACVMVTPPATTTYILKTLSPEGCLSIDSVRISVIEPVSKQASCITSVKVSPNPLSTNTLTVSLISERGVNISIVLTAANGAIVKKRTGMTEQGENLFGIDVSGLQKGTYMLTVRCLNGESVTKTVTIL